MAIFGKIDAKALANNVSVTNGSTTVTTTGDFTNKTTADFIQNGDVLSLSTVQYTVESVVSATTLKLRTVYAGSTGTVTAANALRRTPPKEVATLLIDENGQNAHFSSGTSLIFIDKAEAALEENKARGLKFPGWWAYRTYIDADGNTRFKTECLAFVRETAANAGDFDTDNPAADDISVASISISGQPANRTGVADPYSNASAFSVTASATSGSPTYQWQYQTATGTSWKNCTGTAFTTPTAAALGLSAAGGGAAKATYNGYKFRVKVGSTAGAIEVISTTATLTYA